MTHTTNLFARQSAVRTSAIAFTLLMAGLTWAAVHFPSHHVWLAVEAAPTQADIDRITSADFTGMIALIMGGACLLVALTLAGSTLIIQHNKRLTLAMGAAMVFGFLAPSFAAVGVATPDQARYLLGMELSARYEAEHPLHLITPPDSPSIATTSPRHEEH